MRGSSSFLFLLLCSVVLASKISLMDFVSDYSSEEETQDDCKRLPPNPKRTSVAGESRVDIVDLLSGGISEFSSPTGSDASAKDAILVLGNTGSGKTTLTQILTGNLSRLHAVYTHGGQLVIIDDDERIGAPSTVSRTIIPELVSIQDENNQTVYFYDCPGFDDTRGSEQDLAANYFMDQMLKKLDRAKLLFLTMHSSVKPGHDRLDFDLLVQHATNFVRNLTHFENSIGLVLTKVSSYTEHGSYLKDRHIFRGVHEFLLMYRQTLADSLHEEIDLAKRDIIFRKLQFVDILMKPKRIQISRSPEVCGPLINSKVVLGTRKNVTKLYESLEFNSVGNKTNFGYTLKDKTRLAVHNFTEEVNKEIYKKINETVYNALAHFVLESTYFENDTDNLLEIIMDSKQLFESLSEINTLNSQQFGKEFAQSLEKVNITVPVAFNRFFAQQEMFLEFFEEASRSEIDRSLSTWLEPLSEKQFQNQYQAWVDFTGAKIAVGSNNVVKSVIKHQVETFQQWFQNHKFSFDGNISKTSNELESYREITLQIELSSSPISLANSLKSFFDSMGYDMSNQFIEFMERQDQNFEYLDSVMSTKSNRSIDQWAEPINDLKQKFAEQNTWYLFLSKVKETLLSFTIQSRKASLIRSENVTALGFLEENQIVVVSNQIKQLGEKFQSQKHYQFLQEIIDWCIAQEKIECDSSGVLIMSGNIVMLESLTNPNSCIDNVSTVKVFAAEKMYLGRNVTIIGKDSFAIVTPELEIIGVPFLDLSGKNAPDIIPGKAHIGHGYGGRGADGVPGKAGGPGCSIQIVSDSVVGGDRLSISVDGGIGGKGQDGGDGHPGMPGRQSNYGTHGWHAGVYGEFKWGHHGEAGHRGGDGGNGGASGIGGKPGNFQFMTRIPFECHVSNSSGSDGEVGNAGKFGKGGTGLASRHCVQKWATFMPVHENCWWSHKPHDGPNGIDGTPNLNTNGRQEPSEPALINSKVVLEEYVQMFEVNQNFVTREFFKFVENNGKYVNVEEL